MRPDGTCERLVWVLALATVTASVGCTGAESVDASSSVPNTLSSDQLDYCALPPSVATVITARPSDEESPVDDVNWFARPVLHAGTDRIVAFASHNQNYLYNLSDGVRVRIPDRSDAVATPDGRYMTVPSSYTPDANIRFYPMQPLLDGLAAGQDVDTTAPVFVHEHPSMKKVYYQSTGVIAEQDTAAGHVVDYRLMFSGGADESNFRIVDYRFTHDTSTGELLDVAPSAPMALCPAVRNDLNTPFISKDARYVAAYTSADAGTGYTPGASLKVFEITSTDPTAGTTTCQQVVDFGFAAGKADFNFDGSMLAFHISQGAYLTPFINGGLPSSTITDVVVARLDLDDTGRITGTKGVRRLTTSLEAGVGSYFPAFFPDDTLFYVANSVPRESDRDKRFHFRVMDLQPTSWQTGMFATEAARTGWQTIAALWEHSCTATHPGLGQTPFPLQTHEAPWQALALSPGQCRALVNDAQTAATRDDAPVSTDWSALSALCSSLGS